MNQRISCADFTFPLHFKEMILALAGGLEQTPPVNHGIVPLLEENYEN